MSGGGGNLIPGASDILAERVGRAVEVGLGAVFEAYTWNEGNRKSVGEAHSPYRLRALEKLFKSKDILTIGSDYQKTSILLRYNDACKHLREDGVVEDKDGSADIRTNSICISMFRLKNQKATFTEVVALVAHELSHLLGADEAEAGEVQDILLTMITPDIFQEFHDMSIQIDRLNVLNANFVEFAGQKNMFQLCSMLSYAKENLHDIFKSAPMSTLYDSRIGARLTIMNGRLCQNGLSWYDKTFGKKKRASLDSLVLNMLSDDGPNDSVRSNLGSTAAFLPSTHDIHDPILQEGLKLEVSQLVADLAAHEAIAKATLNKYIKMEGYTTTPFLFTVTPAQSMTETTDKLIKQTGYF